MNSIEAVYQWARQAWVIWMILLFLGIVFWAFRPKNKRRFEEDGMIPFKDENNGG